MGIVKIFSNVVIFIELLCMFRPVLQMHVPNPNVKEDLERYDSGSGGTIIKWVYLFSKKENFQMENKVVD